MKTNKRYKQYFKVNHMNDIKHEYEYIMNQVAHLCSDGGKLGSEFPLASVHVAPLCVVFVAWGEGPGFCALCTVRDTSPVGFGSNKCHRENLKTNGKPLQVTQNQQKPNLIEFEASNLFQDLIDCTTLFS